MTSIATSHNLARLAERAIECRGDHPALLFEDRWYGSVELFEGARRVAGGLVELGVRPGDRVVVMMANCPEVGIAYNALWRAGAVVTPAMFLLPSPDLRHVIADAQASAVITTPEFLGKVTVAVEGLDHVRAVICTQISEGAADGSTVDLAALAQAEPIEIVPRENDELAALLYTGGTTGRSKGVMLSHANLHYTGHAAHEAAHLPGIDRALVTLHLSHPYGLLVTISAVHNPDPGMAVLLRWFDPGAFLSVIEEHRLQMAAVVPSMLAILLAQALDEHDLSSLRYMTSGGAPLAPEVQAEFRRRVPSVSIRQGYGLTETAALISTNPAGREKSGSVGKPVPGCQVKVVDGAGRELAPGEPGEICARSPGVMGGYWCAPEATAQALQEGWLHTGDIATWTMRATCTS
ncbi:MAG: class I adenylate-forming enzyme family protein [Solirubrobacteraceae bacterium]